MAALRNKLGVDDKCSAGSDCRYPGQCAVVKCPGYGGYWADCCMKVTSNSRYCDTCETERKQDQDARAQRDKDEKEAKERERAEERLKEYQRAQAKAAAEQRAAEEARQAQAAAAARRQAAAQYLTQHVQAAGVDTEYVSRLQQQKIDESNFYFLEKYDLINAGIPIGPAARLATYIEARRSQQA